MTDNYDQLALSWVRKEINNTLEQARQGLENYVENNEDQTQIQFCVNCLHQVHGTLQMLEFAGSARLAKEMEALAEKIANAEVANAEAAYEVLMRGILQMPGYLERVEEGQKDVPVVLLPLINEMRKAAGEPPVAEEEVFHADVSSVQPPKPQEVVSESDRTSAFHNNAKKLRAHFQKGLTGLIRGKNIKESLARIHKVLLRLEALTEGRSVSRLWWVADGFIFAIAEGGHYKKKEVHQLLSRVDKQIKRLADLGLAAQDDVIEAEFLSKLLYYVARSNSKNERVQTLKMEFRLEDALPSEEQLDKQKEKLMRPDSSAVTNVVEAIHEELASVKDQLDLFVRSQNKDSSSLQNLVESLVRIADTLTLLELAIPRDVVRQQVKQLQKLLDLNKQPDDSTIMDVAGALLFVEANLSHIQLDEDEPEVSEEDATRVSEEKAKLSQVDDATVTLIKVARKSLQMAKDAIINYIASNFDVASLDAVPNLLQEVMGGVRIINLDEAADILQVAHDYVSDAILGRGDQPDEAHLDALADIITSVEYFLEANEEGRREGLKSILRGAQASHDLLADTLMQIPDLPEPVAESLQQPEETLQVEGTEAEVEDTSDDVADEPVAEDAPAQVIPISPSQNKEADQTLIDDDVLEIFLEEVEEEQASIAEMLPRWRADLKDEEALTSIRRSFHTLKGSGRLVGAKAIGEMAWAIENMLNKVIQESIPADMNVVAAVQDALNLLPEMVNAFANQQAYRGGDLEVIARAEHLAEGKPFAEFHFEGDVEATASDEITSAAGTEPEATEEAQQTESIDPVLLDIFVSEAETHLKAIKQYVDKAPNEGSVGITDALIRALHTLKGSAHMAGIAPIAELTGPLEKYARIVKGSGGRFEQAVVALLGEVESYLSDALNTLKQQQSFEQARYDEIKAKVDALQPALPAASTEAEAQQRDQHLVSIFLTEAHDILQESAALLQALRDGDQSQAATLESEFATLNRGAEVVAIDALLTLTQALHRLAQFALGQASLSEDFFELFAEGTQQVETMLNRLASQEDLGDSSPLVERIDAWLAAANTAGIPEDMDQELVELFVEEADELIELARALFERWQAQLNDKELNAELRRVFHTLKGSSRMAGAMAIGELAYAAEDMFNTVIDSGREQTELDYALIVATTDRLEQMVNVLRGLRWPQADEKAITLLRRHLAGESVSLDDLEADKSLAAATQETTPAEEGQAEAAQDLVDESPTEEFTEESAANANDAPAELAEDEEGALADAEQALDDLLEQDELSPADDASVTVDEELVISAPDEMLEQPEAEAVATEDDEELTLPTLEDSLDEADAAMLELQAEDTSSDESFGQNIELPTLQESADDIEFESEATSDEEHSEAVESPTAEFDADTTESTLSETAEDSATGEEIEASTDEAQAKAEDILETSPEETGAVEEDDGDIIGLRPELIEAVHGKEPELVSEETIAPAAPLEMQGNVQKIELDDDGEEVLEIYLEEADELLMALDESLNEWAADLSNSDAIDNLQRTLHTFKGGARLSDLMVLGDLTHEMETYFERVNGGQIEAKPEHVDFMLRGHDIITALVNEVREHRQMTKPVQFMEQLSTLIETGELVAGDDSVAAQKATDSEKTAREQDKATPATVIDFEEKKQAQQDTRKATVSQEVIRVPAGQLENLVNLAGETSIFRSRLEQQMSVLRYNLEEMSQTIERLREQLRNLEIETDAQIAYRREVTGGSEYEEFDPLEMDRYTRQQELTRSLGESAVDLLSLKEALDNLTADSETLLLQQGRVNTEMQESLMRTRMIPFESLVPRLRRMVRQISTELGKTIALSISAEGEMDRSVLERMIAPLEHMLRNAMDHGIESPEERRAQGKPETGNIRISLYREGSEVFIKIEDDGRGLDLQKIRNKAIERGLIKPETEMSDHDLQQLILEAGFSTAEKVTQISGRGVGMDVVSSEIKHLGGVIEIDSKQGVGSTFTVRLPFTVSVNQALMVKIGEDVYAIPLSNIEGIVRVSPFELEEYYNNPDTAFAYAGINYHMHYLGQLLDHNVSANLQGVTQPLPVLLLHGADHPTALQVDDLLGSREIVVKSLGTQLSTISGLSGATILGDGRVVLILDMPALLRRVDSHLEAAAEAEAEAPVETAIEEARLPKVMVVDDSITVRKVTSRLLERHDFEVITAKDGVDALAVLEEERPDVMLLDIEMPRMDGFELATIIRHDDKLKYLPIIMITSRTGEKHRERAESIGVNRYLGKPYNEVDLIDTINELLPN